VVATGFNLLGLSSHLASALWGLILLGVIAINRMIGGVET
jgi:ribose/xylose/arabinose/galactoside ABC-type transport system permease subunit